MLRKSFKNQDRAYRGISEEAMEKLMCYDWPGNCRELRNIIDRITTLSDDYYIGSDVLPPEIRGKKGRRRPNEQPQASKRDNGKSEREQITELMKNTRGNKRVVAEQLGISRPTLYRRLKEYNIPEDREYWK